jgi:hypothetical protein
MFLALELSEPICEVRNAVAGLALDATEEAETLVAQVLRTDVQQRCYLLLPQFYGREKTHLHFAAREVLLLQLAE